MTKKASANIEQKIITTSLKLFAQNGFDATSVEQIATTAGITKSLIYYYFKSKDDILATIFQNFIEQSQTLKKKIQNHLYNRETQIDIQVILKDYILPFLVENKDIIKIAFSESLKEAPVTPHLNIFKYFEQSSRTDLKIIKDFVQNCEPMLFNLGSFFLFWAPLLSFVIFSDEWCEYYNCDINTATELFIQAYQILFEALLKLFELKLPPIH